MIIVGIGSYLYTMVHLETWGLDLDWLDLICYSSDYGDC